jgi:preprotein translocase subunit SecA
MRIFGADRITGLMERLGMEEDVPIEAPLVNRAIENAQRKVEAMHFDTRKNVFEYDNVMNEQRRAIYALRKQILEGRYRPEILDDQLRKEQGHRLPPPPDRSGPHTLASLIAATEPRVRTIVDAHAAQLVEEGAATQEPSDPPWPATGVDPERLRHDLYRHFGAVAYLDDVVRDRGAILERATHVVAQSLIEQRERIHDLGRMLVEGIVMESCPADVHPDDWDVEGLEQTLAKRFYTELELKSVPERVEGLIELVWQHVERVLDARENEFGLYTFLFYVRQFYLREIDEQWIAHLRNIEHLRTGIGLVSYATRNPKNEYKLRGYELFKDMWETIEQTVFDRVLSMRLTAEQVKVAEEGAEYETSLTRALSGQRGAVRRSGADRERLDRLQEAARRAAAQLAAAVDEHAATAGGPESRTPRRSYSARPNEPCPCGSGKRFKKCHGAAVDG